jgi:hypothetical protein
MFVSYEDAILAIQGHCYRPHELPISGTVSFAKFANVFVIQCAYTDPDGGRAGWITSIEDKNSAIGIHDYVIWIGKTAAVKPVVHDSYGLNVV